MPNILMVTIVMRKIVTNIAGLIDEFQNWMVNAPEIISTGRTKSHCNA